MTAVSKAVESISKAEEILKQATGAARIIDVGDHTMTILLAVSGGLLLLGIAFIYWVRAKDADTRAKDADTRAKDGDTRAKVSAKDADTRAVLMMALVKLAGEEKVDGNTLVEMGRTLFSPAPPSQLLEDAADVFCDIESQSTSSSATSASALARRKKV